LIVAALKTGDPIAAFEVAFQHVQNGKARMLAVPQSKAEAAD
jgi:DNA-binding FadR family transcriptional regulator